MRNGNFFALILQIGGRIEPQRRSRAAENLHLACILQYSARTGFPLYVTSSSSVAPWRITHSGKAKIENLIFHLLGQPSKLRNLRIKHSLSPTSCNFSVFLLRPIPLLSSCVLPGLAIGSALGESKYEVLRYHTMLQSVLQVSSGNRETPDFFWEIHERKEKAWNTDWLRWAVLAQLLANDEELSHRHHTIPAHVQPCSPACPQPLCVPMRGPSKKRLMHLFPFVGSGQSNFRERKTFSSLLCSSNFLLTALEIQSWGKLGSGSTCFHALSQACRYIKWGFSPLRSRQRGHREKY